MPARQLASSLPAKTTCNTGQSAAASGSAADPARTEKPVAFRIAAGGISAKSAASKAAASPSFRLLTKTGNGRSRRAVSASTSASTGAVLPDCTNAR